MLIQPIKFNTPTGTRTGRALASGKHVLVEKPFTADAQEARCAGVPFISHQYSYYHAVPFTVLYCPPGRSKLLQGGRVCCAERPFM